MNDGLHIFDEGTGPAVVLLHGLPSPPSDLENLTSELPGMRVIVPHLPGYGASVPRPGRQGVRAIDELLVDALRERQVENPVVVGYSMGGYRAISLAPRVGARAVLVLAGFADLSPVERTGMTEFASMLRKGQDLRAVLPDRFRAKEWRVRAPADDALVESWLDVARSSTLVEELEDLASAPSLLDALGDLQCPVVARTGELDVAVPPIHARAIAGAAREGTLELVSGVAHAVLLEDRAGTLEAIRRVCALAPPPR